MAEIEQAYLIIAEVLSRSSGEPITVTPDTRLTQLSIDSLSLIEVIFEIEERFDVELPFNANDLTRDGGGEATVGDLVAMVEAARVDKGHGH